MADNRATPASGLWTRTIAGLVAKLSAFYLCKTSYHFPITVSGLADCRLAARVWRKDAIKAEGEYCEHCKAGFIVTFTKRKVVKDESRLCTTTNASKPVCQ